MAWIDKYNRYQRVCLYVIGQLNDIGIYPFGAEQKQWVRREVADAGIEPDRDEIKTVLSDMLSQGAITQADINHFAKTYLKKITFQ